MFFSKISKFTIIWGFPFILIYAVGGVILMYGFKFLKNRPITLFLVGMISMTIFELLVSYFCEYILHAVLWSYSDQFMNFQGRICLSSSIAWGIISVMTVKVLSPLFNKIYKKLETREIFRLSLVSLLIYVGICYILRTIT